MKTQPTTDHASRTTDKPNWRLYAAAGAAALAAGSAADAAIIYVAPTSPEVSSGGGLNRFKVDGVSVGIAASQSSARIQGFSSDSSLPSLRFAIDPYTCVHKFAAGQAIKNASAVTAGALRSAMFHRGEFSTGKTGFVGFQLPGTEGGGLGWMRLELLDTDNGSYPNEIEAIDWAYNNAGGGINAGQTSSSVPEPSALACWPWAAPVCSHGGGGGEAEVQNDE